jgi:hypothetical protein
VSFLISPKSSAAPLNTLEASTPRLQVPILDEHSAYSRQDQARHDSDVHSRQTLHIGVHDRLLQLYWQTEYHGNGLSNAFNQFWSEYLRIWREIGGELVREDGSAYTDPQRTTHELSECR